MPSVNLTDTYIKSLKPGARVYEVFDKNVSCLTIRIWPSGQITFSYIYRMHGMKTRRSLGAYPAISLAYSRTEAKKLRSCVGMGIDPRVERDQQRRDARTATFAEVGEDYIAKEAKQKNKSWRQAKRIIDRQLIPWLGKQPMPMIDRRMIHSGLDKILQECGKSSANHAFSEIRRIFNWSVERGIISDSPCRGMKAPAKTFSRDRVLSDDELFRILKALDVMEWPFSQYGELLILTGQRRSEVAGMKWSQIDLEKKIWTQPKESNKSGREHEVRLSQDAQQIIAKLPRMHDCDLVFPARGRSDRSISGFSKWKAILDKTSGVQNWTLHDIRRTVATGMAALGVPIHVTELILNHSSSKLSGIAGTYNRHPYTKEQQAALEKWAMHVRELLESRS